MHRSPLDRAVHSISNNSPFPFHPPRSPPNAINSSLNNSHSTRGGRSSPYQNYGSDHVDDFGIDDYSLNIDFGVDDFEEISHAAFGRYPRIPEVTPQYFSRTLGNQRLRGQQQYPTGAAHHRIEISRSNISSPFESNNRSDDDENGNSSRSPRNPHQTQALSQYELLGIPEPNFSTAPFRRDRLAAENDDFYDEFDDSPPIRHFPTRRNNNRNNLSSNYGYNFNSTTPISSYLSTFSSTSSRSRNPATVTSPYGTTRSTRGNRTVQTTRNASTSNRTNRTSHASTTTNTSININVRNNNVNTNINNNNNKPKEEKPKVTLKFRVVSEKEVADEAVCSVCLEPFKKDAKVAELKCKHIYHKECITPWIESHFTCPICRANIADDPPPKART